MHQHKMIAFSSLIGIRIKLGVYPLSAQRLWLIKADQRSMSWPVFSNLLWKVSSSDATFQWRLLFSPRSAFGRDWQRFITPLRNVTSAPVPSSFGLHGTSLARFLPIALVSAPRF